MRLSRRSRSSRRSSSCCGWYGPGALLVRVEALARFPAKVSGGYHPAEQRTRPVLRIAEAVVHHVQDREADVEADEIGEGQRTHRVVQSALHHRVNRGG